MPLHVSDVLRKEITVERGIIPSIAVVTGVDEYGGARGITVDFHPDGRVMGITPDTYLGTEASTYGYTFVVNLGARETVEAA